MNSNPISGVLEGARELWPHNEDVTGCDSLVNDAVQRALDSNTESRFDRWDDSSEAMTAHMPQVRLLLVKPGYLDLPFLDALDAAALPNMHGPCDRCGTLGDPEARLWVRAGGSIVQVECCRLCKEDLDGFGLALVWR